MIECIHILYFNISQLSKEDGDALFVYVDSTMYMCIKLFPERLSQKVRVTILKDIVGSFEFTALQGNLKEWHERPWTYVCEC